MTTDDHTGEVDLEGTPQGDHDAGEGTPEGDMRVSSEGDTGVTWVTLRDASNATGVSISTLRKWRKKGELESQMAPGPTGERIEVPMTAVTDLAAERGAGTVPPAAPVAALATPDPEPAPTTLEPEPPAWAMELLARYDARTEVLMERLAQAERERANAERDAAIERHRREKAETELARLHGFVNPATGGAEREEPAEIRREPPPASTTNMGWATRWDRLRQWRPGWK